MLSNPTRRWLAGLGVAGALIAASAVPAVAAPGVPLSDRQATEFGLYANNVIVASDGSMKWVRLDSLATEPLTSYTVKVDRSAVQSFAHVQSGGFNNGVCREDGPILSCTVEDDDERDSRLLVLPVFAKDTAKLGQHGDLTFTVSTPYAGTQTFRSTVIVGEGVDLAAGPTMEMKGAPGETVRAPIRVFNVGRTTADGVVLFFYGPAHFIPSEHYENCEYSVTRFKDHAFACTFDDPLAPGVSAVVDSSFGFTIPSDAWAPNAQEASHRWLTRAEWQDFRDEPSVFGQFQKGTGPTLKLATPARAQSTPQTNTNPDNGANMWLVVTGDQKADVVADGASVTGTVGRTVPVTVGWTDNGPAAATATALVEIPAGAYAAKVPDRCVPRGYNGDLDRKPVNMPGFPAYVCQDSTILHKGDKVTLEFALRIDKAGPLTGVIAVNPGPGETDLNPANDTAKILVNAPGGGDNPGDGDNSPGSGGGNGGGEGGDGGSLPITGSSTGLIAGIGALLLVAGLGGYLVARRRKTRFVA
ncbi:LPXTG cell wall anchor domain-containing protein [Micromonospora sp. NPDC047738]|uniref:LPXTG cell wall anchor domain-containing protein n=1 Tax=Micromonospora sp. NPDC047738 TaxID=3155741 RepID=UPI0033FE82C1